jgi:hypothetical protein
VALGEVIVARDQVVPQTKVAEYFLGCWREGYPGHGPWLAAESREGKRYSFCAAFIGFCEAQAATTNLLKNLLPPWRSGALELMRDAINGKRPGQRWIPLKAILDGYVPKKGAVLIYQNTSDDTRGHAEMVVWAEALGFRAVGANERNRRIHIDPELVRWNAVATADRGQPLKLLGVIDSD